MNEGRKDDFARAWRGVRTEIRRRGPYALTGCGVLLLVVGTMVQLFLSPPHRWPILLTALGGLFIGWGVAAIIPMRWRKLAFLYMAAMTLVIAAMSYIFARPFTW